MAITKPPRRHENTHYLTLLLVVLIITATFAFCFLYSITGPSWDLIVHYFNGKSITNPQLYTSKNIILNEVTVQGKDIYYEAYRAPLSVAIFGLLTSFSVKPLLLYSLILWAAFLIAVYKFRKDVKFDTLITFAVLLSPYIIKITFFLSSEEILSIIFVMLSLGLLIKEEPLAGVTLGIASLAKYPTIILLPTVLLLYKPKKIIRGFLLEFLVIVPWLVFNFVISGNPFTSYIQSYATVLGSALPGPILLSTLNVVFGYPVIIWGYMSDRSRKNKIR